MIIEIESKRFGKLEMIIDDEDYDKIKDKKVHIDKDGYAFISVKINGKNTTSRVHRLVMDAPKGKQVDHINHQRLDNRKINLRLANSSENNMNKPVMSTNTSGYKGVHFRKSLGHWRATIESEGKKIELGLYETPEEAAVAYNQKAKELYGEFAWLNPVDENIKPKRVTYKRSNNRSKYKGITHSGSGWVARLTHDGKRLYLGHFNTEEEAFEAYKKKVTELFGSNFNFEKVV